MRRLWEFPGGLHLDDHKAESTRRPVERLPLPATLTVPLQQHIGEAAEILVAVGDRVLGGQTLARATGYVSAAVHAGTSGTVTAVEERPVPHPSGLTAMCVVIDTDGRDQWVAPLPPLDWQASSPMELRQRVRECGLVGLGGAAFPSSVKLNPTGERALEHLIVNGAECEPWIACDDMLMRERAAEIVEGIRIVAHALRPREVLIGVEDNKPEAIDALRSAVEAAGAREIEVVPVPTRYPAGGEKQLVYTLTGKEVPSDGIPLQIGVVCHNVGTLAALRRAVVEGRPLTDRYVAVTGPGIREPRVVEALVGTPFRDLVDFCGGYAGDVDRLLMGGPMMGFAVADDGVALVKATNCILAATPALFPAPDTAMPCIRCGACTDACPASLLPQQLYWYARAQDFERVQDHSLFDCIECGACAYVCPSHIPLVQYFRYAKTEIWAQERDRQKADIARDRHEFRQLRLEREAREKREKRERKKAALRSRRAPEGEGLSAPGDDKKAAIDAALAKARAKKAVKDPARETEATRERTGNDGDTD